jgi:RND family efflux transporter MFP subunit
MLIDAAESAEDLAQSEFDTAYRQYNDALTSSAAETIMEARAQVAAAQSSYDYALDYLMSLQTEEDALQVRVAQAGVGQAEAAVTQAEGNLAQAQAALDLANLQLDRVNIKAPISGTVIFTSVRVGDMAIAGGTVMTIANLEELELTVYIPETWYGQIVLGKKVDITVDSFPAEIFKGEVVRIADSAEFTPRNVQSADGRATTVYAIKIAVPNPSLRLKPGMPADVDFGQ